MIIKLTKKARGELVLSSINRSLRHNQPGLPINNQQFLNDDIQKALKLGFIEVEGGVPSDVETLTEKIMIRSLVNRTLVLPTIPGVLRLRQVASLTMNEFMNTDIQQALNLGLIEKVDGSQPEPEQPSVADILDVLEGSNEAEDEAEDDIIIDIADKFKKTGEAVIVEKPEPKKIEAYDPRPPEAPAKGKGKGKGKGKVKSIKPAGKARSGQGQDSGSLADDGIELNMLSDGNTLKVE